MNKQTSVFSFDSYTFNKTTGKLSLVYTITHDQHTHSCTEVIHFPKLPKDVQRIPPQLLEHTLQMIFLICGISYWKTTCAPKILIPSFTLTETQATFFNNLYTKGLGEFFYTNALDYRSLVSFPFEKGKDSQTPLSLSGKNRSLLFFGGGKDSIVSAMKLQESKKQFSLFMVGESEIQKKTASLIETDTLQISRTIDPELFEINKEPGVFNGHIPISAVWAGISVLAGLLYDYHYLITSNELSANYGNVWYLGEEMNHQWSKSYEFETAFQSYIQTFLTPDMTFFSLLRQLHEFKITELFSKYPQFFQYFSSCNKNFKIKNPLQNKRWCTRCPKCLFVYILLSAFLSKHELISIFGHDLLADASLLPLFKDLLGIDHFKPFECVGTPEETIAALYTCFARGEFRESTLMQYFTHHFSSQFPSISSNAKKILKPETMYELPEAFSKISFL